MPRGAAAQDTNAQRQYFRGGVIRTLSRTVLGHLGYTPSDAKCHLGLLSLYCSTVEVIATIVVLR